MTEPGIASVPTVRAVTVEGKELKKFDIELSPNVNQPYGIYDRIGFVTTSYTKNNQTTRLENLDADLSCTPDTSPKVNGHPNHHLNLAGTPDTSPKLNGHPELDFAPLHTPNTLPKVNGCEYRDLTSNGTLILYRW